MQTMPAAVATLLKSRQQVGVNRPAHEVTIAGMTGGWQFPDSMSETVPSITQGYGTTSVDISNWVERASGGYICCWIDPTNKTLMTGYSADLDFLDTPYAIESYVETAAITVDSILGHQVVLHKRTDGKILAFVGNCTLSSTWLKCYISNSGDGDDWAYYSTIVPSGDTGTNGTPSIWLNVPLVTQTGRLLMSFGIGNDRYSGYIFLDAYTAYSDDLGETWTVQPKGRSLGTGIDYVYQACQLSDGGIFYCETSGSANDYIYKSNDDGATWSLAGYFDSIGDPINQHGMGVSFYYETASDTLYAVSLFWGFYKYDHPVSSGFLTAENWVKILPGWSNSSAVAEIYKVGGRLAFYNSDGGVEDKGQSILGIEPVPISLLAKSISIDRSQGMAAQATIILDNKSGQYSPDSSGAWAGVLMPNVLVTIRQGYGADLVQTFVGYIDMVEMTTFPAELRLTCRDKGKLALDRIVTNSVDGGHYVKYINQTVEAIFSNLAGLCGLTTGTVEETGLTLASKLFSWESYADAFSWLADMAAFEWHVDEQGVLHFVHDKAPTSPMAAYVFREGEDIVSLGYTISDADLYYQAIAYGSKDYDGTVNTSGVTVTWVSGDKFDTNWTEDKIITIAGSTFKISAVTSDTSLTVKATIGNKTGASYQTTNVIKASANFGAPLTYNLFSQKVLKIDVSDANTTAMLQEIADRAVALMICRARVVDFAAVAVPWLQVGDFIQVVESTSTISELYRITDLSFSQGPEGYTMQVKCYWYGAVS